MVAGGGLGNILIGGAGDDLLFGEFGDDVLWELYSWHYKHGELDEEAAGTPDPADEGRGAVICQRLDAERRRMAFLIFDAHDVAGYGGWAKISPHQVNVYGYRQDGSGYDLEFNCTFGSACRRPG